MDSGIVETYKWDVGNYAVQISHEINSKQRVHVRYYTGNEWKPWNELWQVRYKDVTYGNISSLQGTYLLLGTEEEGIEILSVALMDWSANTGAFSVMPYLQRNVYLLANQGFSINRLKVRIYYRYV